MNTKANQRYKDTDRRIREVFLTLLAEKELVGVTVRDICDSCGINRSSFYAHYDDIYDLLSKMEADIRQEMYSSFDGTGASTEHFLSREYFEIVLRHMSRHRVFYRAHIDGFGRQTVTNGLEQIKEYVYKPYMEKLGLISPARIDYHFTFFCYGFVAAVRRWLDGGCIESPEELAAILWDSIPPAPHQ